MKYILGSLIISFGIILIILVILSLLQIKAPENIMEYLGLAWFLLAIVTYPLARKIVR